VLHACNCLPFFLCFALLSKFTLYHHKRIASRAVVQSYDQQKRTGYIYYKEMIYSQLVFLASQAPFVIGAT
jgi:hypothetical protein